MKPKGKPRRMTKKTPQESKVRKRPGYSAGGTALKQQQAQAKLSLDAKPTGLSTGPSKGPRLKKAVKAPIMPTESKRTQRPGMARGGKARMKYADGGMPKAKPC